MLRTVPLGPTPSSELGGLEDGEGGFFSVTSAPTKDSFGRPWKLADDSATKSQSAGTNGWNPTGQR